MYELFVLFEDHATICLSACLWVCRVIIENYCIICVLLVRKGVKNTQRVVIPFFFGGERNGRWTVFGGNSDIYVFLMGGGGNYIVLRGIGTQRLIHQEEFILIQW